MTKKMRWWDVLFPPSPMKVLQRDRKTLEQGIELTDPAEFESIKRRLDVLERRFDELDERFNMITGRKSGEDATGTT